MKHLITILLFLSALTAFTQSTETGIIIGEVFTDENQPLENATVRFLASDGVEFMTISDSSGRYLFTDIPVGSGDLNVSHKEWAFNEVQGLFVMEDSPAIVASTAAYPLLIAVISCSGGCAIHDTYTRQTLKEDRLFEAQKRNLDFAIQSIPGVQMTNW